MWLVARILTNTNAVNNQDAVKNMHFVFFVLEKQLKLERFCLDHSK